LDKPKNNITLRVVILLLVFIILVPLLPIIISGRWDWWEAWVFAFISIAGFALSHFLAGRQIPGLLTERSRFMQHVDAASWDKVLSSLVGLGGGVIPLMAGLDELFNWSPAFNTPVKIAALICILIGYVWGSYALIANRYFSGMVRLQSERGHTVISSGPYRWMRHPGYAGSILTYLAIPPFLDSAWTFIPAVILVTVLIIRTYLEDNFLQEQLTGYQQYSQQVRYRLIPGIW
jgi:protein-S-isoprenylcysteine O-methyltransferase Ste14